MTSQPLTRAFQDGIDSEELAVGTNGTRRAIATEETPIRVLVVEDHEILAEGLSRLLDTCADIEVAGVVGTVKDAVAKALELRPDVVLMDYQLPDGDGVAAVTQIKQEVPTTQVVMLTGSGDDERLARRVLSRPGAVVS